MHKILLRQIKRFYGGIEQFPKEQEKFLEAISKTYYDYEKEYELVERSLSISSKELTEMNTKMHADMLLMKQHAQELEKFNRLMVDRELKMIDLKKEVKRLKGEHKKAPTRAHDGTSAS